MTNQIAHQIQNSELTSGNDFINGSGSKTGAVHSQIRMDRTSNELVIKNLKKFKNSKS